MINIIKNKYNFYINKYKIQYDLYFKTNFFLFNHNNNIDNYNLL